MKKSFLGVSFYPGLWGKWDSPPVPQITIFTLQIEWDTSPNVCVIYPNSMIYFPVQCDALYSVLSGVVFSFSTKCLKVSDNAPRYASC